MAIAIKKLLIKRVLAVAKHQQAVFLSQNSKNLGKIAEKQEQ